MMHRHKITAIHLVGSILIRNRLRKRSFFLLKMMKRGKDEQVQRDVVYLKEENRKHF